MSEILEVANNCLELSIACNAVLISLLAFVYPQIFETKKRLKDISEVFVNKYKSNFAIEYYFSILSFLLCISIIFSIFCVFENERFNCADVLYYNIIFSFIGIAVSAWVYYDLEKLYNKPEKLFSLKKILRSQKKENDDLQLIQTLLARNLVNRYDIYNNKYYLSLLKEIFMKNMEKLTELDMKQKQKELFKWYQDTKYLYRPLEIMQFINQEAVRCGNEGASAEIIQCVLQILEKMLEENNLSSLYQQETSVSNTLKRMFIYKIIHNSLVPEWDMRLIIYGYYKTLLDYDKSHIKGIINGNNLNPNENIFQIITHLIKQNDKIDIFVPFLSCLKNMETPSNDYVSDIHRLNCEILAYMLLHKKYSLAYDYMYWQQPLDNSKSIYFFQLIPSSIYDIVRCYIRGASIFQENQTFEENEDSRIYKVYILFILLYTLKHKNENNKDNNLLNYDNTEINENILNDVDDHSLFFNYITGSNFENDYEKFTKSTEILRQFRIEDTNGLKKFIQEIFAKIEKVIEAKRKSILNSSICSTDQDLFEVEFKKGYDLFIKDALSLATRLQSNNIYTFIKNYFRKRMNNNKSWNKWFYSRSLVTRREKSRIVATEYTFQTMLTDLLDELYKELVHKIDSKCIEIKNINDVKLNNEDTWGILTNFDNFSRDMEALISKDDIIYRDNNKLYIDGIKIGNKKLPFIQHNFRYIQNGRKQITMYIINVTNIKLRENNIDVQFSETEHISTNLPDLFPKKYETNKDVNVIVSKPFKIAFAKNDVIGYKLCKNIIKRE